LGSDLRSVVDGVLSRDGFDARAAHASALMCSSHQEVVAAVVRGDAQVGVTTASWAIRFGLPFRPLASRPLGLVAPASDLGHPVLVRCWEVLQSLAFRTALERAGGYDASDAGVIRYLRSEPLPSRVPLPASPAAIPAGIGVKESDSGLSRWVIVARDRGHHANAQLLRAAARLRREGFRVGGFVQVPKRTRASVVGYDLQRVIGKTRVPLARRKAPVAASPVLSYKAFQFQEDTFVKAREWLARDVVHADVLVLDGVSTRESLGGGHFEALAWASRLPASVLVVACVRSDRVARIVTNLGLADRHVTVLDAATDRVSEEALEASIVAAARRSLEARPPSKLALEVDGPRRAESIRSKKVR
jgi:nucleoside-triphosphatase THEP1